MIVFKSFDCLNELESVAPNRIRTSRNSGGLGRYDFLLEVVARFGVTLSFSRVSNGLKAIARRIHRPRIRFIEIGGT